VGSLTTLLSGSLDFLLGAVGEVSGIAVVRHYEGDLDELGRGKKACELSRVVGCCLSLELHETIMVEAVQVLSRLYTMLTTHWMVDLSSAHRHCNDEISLSNCSFDMICCNHYVE
jgi:hypothetical protein